MTGVERATSVVPGRAAALALCRRLARSRVALWSAFVLVQLGYGLVNLTSPSNPMGDVRYTYAQWVDQALHAHYVVGIDGPWVYPILALVPMVLAAALGPELYPSTWLSLVLVLDLVALGALTGWGRPGRRLAGGWWWTLFLALVGPIGLGRIDAISVPLVIVGLVLVARRPGVAAVFVTLAAWIKVWPAAVLVALAVAARERAVIVRTALVTSGVVVVLALAFGSGLTVFSFITEQTGRGLQIEAPVSTPWMWLAAAHAPGTLVYYDTDILTFQVSGDGTDVASALTTPAMALAVIAVVLLAVRAVRRGAEPAAVVLLLTLALATALIAFNKVASPQYVTWLAVPIAVAVALGGVAARSVRTGGPIVLAIAALTQLVYPYLYGDVVGAEPSMIAVLTARNALLVALFVLTVVLLARLPRAATAVTDTVSDPDRLPTP
ncbi:glycosyltransferase 87 family protein [Galbitalea sp. SE-J8]|uniref:glycosyltransferase 87 family protein n=1 Tax=Galbitalea sp. SE-J8 TaxID=3054952 RepID=UPI00259CE9D0|nr:glycosyltransferase 87 family protein [Galbitalea sp. SE-J8]MDM4764153.1 glycosyltransferase 87 family protein [Galbitalea sp. SE-J8]